MDDALATFCTHGGRVADARAVFGEGDRHGGDWIDLSTGIAPWAWPVGDLDMGWARLPEPGEIAALEAAAGQAFGVSGAEVVAVPGTDLALRLLALVLKAQRPAVAVPGYGGHRAAWPDAVGISLLPLSGEGGLPPPTPSPRTWSGVHRAANSQALDRAARWTPDQVRGDDVGKGSALSAGGDGATYDLLVLASPANPDGRVTDPATLCALSVDTTVIVDEAYADPAPGLAPHASDRLIVLRSFGKFYGLPGVRLGFVVAGDGVAARLRALLGDWPVSSAAVAIGTAAYRHTAWRQTQHARIGTAGALLDDLLRDAGLPILGRAPLFRLIGCARAGALFTHLARHAILTRPFADQPDRLRLGLPRGAAALHRLATALKDFAR
ncbi:aminotransferase class I/II-fold pyridoxal phosphate-dependent enzyme [Sphingomonas qilianensis]|uniref:aminotransferase class I/II-fold pyridoxal phosphate-dependent enzyme n=1 Tax=Sphingomonas qilianensis TaxID=1736690 RepID=UPI00360F0DD3